MVMKYFKMLAEWTEENLEKFSRVTSVLDDVRISYLQNKKHDPY